jgi:hypothetical protein
MQVSNFSPDRIALKAGNNFVMPVKTGIQGCGTEKIKQTLDSGLRRNDDWGSRIEAETYSVLYFTFRRE